MSGISLNVKGLGVRYGGTGSSFFSRGEGVWALKSVSFSMCAGETLSVVGESGSGKTTLLRSLLGLVRPTVGEIELWGRSLAAMTDDERLAVRRRCGYVPQDPYGSLPPTLTVLGAVIEPWSIVRGSRGETRERGIAKAEELLLELKLPEDLWGARVKYSLSGGQRQRVAVARALILDPEVLLCDEPTAMQDVSTRGEVLDVLIARVRRGMSMILVTHDLLLARQAAKQALVLYRGEIVESGGTDELFERPSHEYTRSLLAALPRI
ncbi:MAG: ATP-binding cassette domain-containing protein [Synergistaceae bacterium]|jgi:peptide/nickel transport system ATP-binding protein|nr:ATP-binding cassette domain-containing protein [Synergistaceae bacterium]